MITIGVPCYNEEENIIPLWKEIDEVCKELHKKKDYTFEIIFVDDGSTDSTYEKLKRLPIKVIKFRKNFGQSAAIDCIFKQARGDYIVLLDGDGQNDPKDIPKLIEKIEETGYDCIGGWRKNRKDSFSKRFISKGANLLRKIFFSDKIRDSGGTLKIYRKECLGDLNLMGEMHRFIPQLLIMKGFKVDEIEVNHRERKTGKTKYGFARMLKGFLDLLVITFWMKFSSRPIHLFGGGGLVMTSFGSLLSGALTIQKIMQYKTFTLMRPLFYLGLMSIIVGIQFIMFGFLADIMVKIYYRKNRPYNIERITTYGNN